MKPWFHDLAVWLTACGDWCSWPQHRPSGFSPGSEGNQSMNKEFLGNSLPENSCHLLLHPPIFSLLPEDLCPTRALKQWCGECWWAAPYFLWCKRLQNSLRYLGADIAFLASWVKRSQPMGIIARTAFLGQLIVKQFAWSRRFLRLFDLMLATSSFLIKI